MADVFSSETRSELMSRIRSKNTSPELAVRRAIHKMGFRYRLHVAQLPGKPDIVFSRLRKIVEVRGCFWHQHQGCSDSHMPKSRIEYWKPKLNRNVARDLENLKRLKADGWQVLIVWDCQLKNLSSVTKRIRGFLNR